MIDTAIVPNRKIVDVLPAVTDLEIVVLNDQLDEPVQEVSRLIFRKAVNVLDMVSNREHTLPPRDWVGANYWMNGFKDVADILGRASRSREE